VGSRSALHRVRLIRPFNHPCRCCQTPAAKDLRHRSQGCACVPRVVSTPFYLPVSPSSTRTKDSQQPAAISRSKMDGDEAYKATNDSLSPAISRSTSAPNLSRVMSTAPSPARSPAPDFVPLPEEFDDDADLDLDANHVEEAPPAYLGPQSRSTSDPRRRSPHRSQSNENNEHGKEKRRRTMHKFDLKKDDKSWLVLRLASLAPSSKSTPVYIGNKPIRGVVELNLDKPQHLISVDVTVRRSFLVSSTWLDLNEHLPVI
jgi:hypothetical protein